MKKIFLFCLLTALLVNCENNSIGPNKPEPIEFRYNLLVTYTRDPSKIRFPEGFEDVDLAVLYLYDPFTKDYSLENVRMKKISENKFQGVVTQGVLVQRSFDPPHYGYVYDGKLYDGIHWDSAKTGEFEVEGEYGVQIKPNGSNGSIRYFYIRK